MDGFEKLNKIQADLQRKYCGIKLGYISDKAKQKARKKHKK